MPRLRLALLTSLVALAPRAALAQDDAIAAERFRPAPLIDDGYALRRPIGLGDVRFGVRLDASYAWQPLVAERGGESVALVGHQLTTSAQLAVGLLERLVFYVGLPAQLTQDGEGLGALPGGDGTQFGDLWLGGRVVIFGETSDAPVALALEVEASFPTATAADETQRYSGDPGAVISPAITFEVRPIERLSIVANLGARLRTLGTLHLAGLRVGHQLSYGLGVIVEPIEDVLRVSAEVVGDATFETFGAQGARESTPLELQVGGRFSFYRGVWIGASAGAGLTAGHGAPDFRAVIALGYQMPEDLSIPEPEPEPPDEGDGADDTLDDDDEWGDYDADGDGLPDSEDGCPDHAEEAGGDGDGCPAGMAPESEMGAEPGSSAASDPETSAAPESETSAAPESETIAAPEPEPETETETEREPEPEPEPETDSESERGPEPEPEVDRPATSPDA